MRGSTDFGGKLRARCSVSSVICLTLGWVAAAGRGEERGRGRLG